MRSRPRSATAAHGGSRPTCSFSTRSRAPTARTTHQRPLSPFQTLRREAPKRQNPDGVIVTNYDAFYIHLYIFIYLRSGGREPSGYPYGLALLVQAGTSPGWGPAAVGADRPCTPPCARAFGGARSQVPPIFTCLRASARPHTAVVSLEGRSSDPVGGAMTAPGGCHSSERGAQRSRRGRPAGH